jgi:hypothetical protein
MRSELFIQTIVRAFVEQVEIVVCQSANSIRNDHIGHSSTAFILNSRLAATRAQLASRKES